MPDSAVPTLSLFQAEWCPYSHRVRSRMTELGVDFVARQVACEPEERDDMRAETGTDGIPLLVLEDGSTVGDADAIVAYLESRFPERPDARRHKAKERAEGWSSGRPAP